MASSGLKQAVKMAHTNEPADLDKLKDAAPMLRLNRPDLALEIERAVDELQELREESARHGVRTAERP